MIWRCRVTNWTKVVFFSHSELSTWTEWIVEQVFALHPARVLPLPQLSQLRNSNRNPIKWHSSNKHFHQIWLPLIDYIWSDILYILIRLWPTCWPLMLYCICIPFCLFFDIVGIVGWFGQVIWSDQQVVSTTRARTGPLTFCSGNWPLSCSCWCKFQCQMHILHSNNPKPKW